MATPKLIRTITDLYSRRIGLSHLSAQPTSLLRFSVQSTSWISINFTMISAKPPLLTNSAPTSYLPSTPTTLTQNGLILMVSSDAMVVYGFPTQMTYTSASSATNMITFSLVISDSTRLCNLSAEITPGLTSASLFKTTASHAPIVIVTNPPDTDLMVC